MSRTFRVGPRVIRSDTPLSDAVLVSPTNGVYGPLVADPPDQGRAFSGRGPAADPRAGGECGTRRCIDAHRGVKEVV